MRDRKSEEERRGEWRRLRVSATIGLTVVAVLWVVHGTLYALGWDATGLGIFPRKVGALFGILLAPLIHGGVLHLFSNSVPLFVLLTGLWLLYPTAAPRLVGFVVLLGGAAVWLFARPSYHIGASGVNYGVVSFLFASGLLRRDPPAMALALLVTFLYGGMVWGVLPLEQRVSHEAHLYSALVGLLGAWWLRRFDRPPPPDDDDDWDDPEELPGWNEEEEQSDRPR